MPSGTTKTTGLNHLGLAVNNLDQTVHFFVDCLGWLESGRDDSYPRSAVTDGKLRLTLWQVDHNLSVNDFQFRQNVGLHHFALEVESEAGLNELADRVQDYPGIKIEFMPELLAVGPRKHMMFNEPGGIRIELIWPGT
ncbi:MAG: lactoylglutathione lyase [Gammaproteobacteria bacterium]|jgi:lactoylglutathione lyase